MATATAYSSVRHYGNKPATEAARDAQRFIDRAMDLDPNLVSSHTAQAPLHLDNDEPRAALT